MKNIPTKIYTIVTSVLILVLPNISYAAFSGLKQLLVDFSGLLNTVVKVLFGLSLIFFFWGVSQFILHAGDAKAREEGKKKMIWGVVALFVFVSIYGIITFMQASLGLPTAASNNSNTFGGSLPTPIFIGDPVPGTTNG